MFGHLKRLVLYARVLVNGEVVTRFLDNLIVKDGKAETIYEAITAYLSEKSVSVSKVIGFGSDGSNVMIGCHIGVGVKIKAVSPFQGPKF